MEPLDGYELLRLGVVAGWPHLDPAWCPPPVEETTIVPPPFTVPDPFFPCSSRWIR
jgi:hypothetical protein